DLADPLPCLLGQLPGDVDRRISGRAFREDQADPVRARSNRGLQCLACGDAADLYGRCGHVVRHSGKAPLAADAGESRDRWRRPGDYRVASIARAAAAGSSARLMGRPITSTLAPESRACRGVTTRFWSPAALPAGRSPGTTKKPLFHWECTAATSCPEQTIPSRPDAS